MSHAGAARTLLRALEPGEHRLTDDTLAVYYGFREVTPVSRKAAADSLKRAGATIVSDPASAPLVVAVTDPAKAASVPPPGAKSAKAKSSKKKRPWWQWALGIFIGLAILGAIIGEEEPGEESDEPVAVATETPTDAAEESTPTPEPTPDPAEVRQEALQAVNEERYGRALVLVADLPDDDRDRVRRAISRSLGLQAKAFVDSGSLGSARSVLRRASRFPSHPAVSRAQVALDGAEAEIAQIKADRRAARIAAREARQAARAAPPAAPSIPSGPCYSIPYTDFPVPPGDDRDADGDGIACES